MKIPMTPPIPVKRLFVAGILLFAVASSWVVGADEREENLKQKLETLLAEGVVIESIEPSPMPGAYIVKVNGQNIFALSAGDHLMIGEVYDTVRGVSLNDELQATAMVEAIENIPESEMILMGEVTVDSSIDRRRNCRSGGFRSGI